MPVKFVPTGYLNVSTDPSQLPGEVSGKVEFSGAMRRCKNLRLDDHGTAQTRYGSDRINETAVDQTTAYLLLEMSGYRYLFAGTKIYRDETSIATGLTSAKWRGILYNPYNVTTQSVFALNGTDRKRIEGASVYEWGIAAPTVAPTLAVGAGTGLTGTYNAKYTYCRKVGTTVVCESNPSPAGTGTALTNDSLSVTWTASSDSQVTHVRVYRTLTGGATYYHDQDIAIGTLNVDTSTADAALGTEVETDHDRPPLGRVVVGPAYNGYCFILKDNLLYYCKANRPEYWPSTYYVETGPPQFPLKAMVFYNGAGYVMNRHEIYLVQGTGQASFFPYPTSAKTGAISQEAVVSIKGRGIYRAVSDGIWLFSGTEDNRVTEENFAPIFRGESGGTLPVINQDYIDNCWLFFDKNKLYFGYPGGAATYPDNILVTNVQTGKIAHYDYSTTFMAITADRTNDRILAVDDAGFVWKIEDRDSADDNGTAISWEIESRAYSDSVYKYFPRYAKYDVEVGAGATANGYVLLNDTSVQTHALSGTRQTRKCLIDGSTGDRLGIRLSGSGSIKIYQVEVE